MRRNFLALLLAWLAAGCGSTPPAVQAPQVAAATFPADALVTQRVVLSARGRQFALNGYLAQSAAGGRRLIITEMFGQVMADVLVKPDGAVHVMRSSRLLRPAWIQRYVAADLRCIFGGATNAACPARWLSATHCEVRRRWYQLDVRIVEVRPGPQPPELFDATPAAKK